MSLNSPRDSHAHPWRASAGRKIALKVRDLPKDSAEEDPLAHYLTQIARFPLLSAQEEAELGLAINQCKETLRELQERLEASPQDADLQAALASEKRRLEGLKTRLINANLRLVVSIAKKYQHRGLSLLDLIDEGNIGLIEAVDRFDGSRGFRFSTYGTWWIRQAILKSLADKARSIRIPIHLLNVIKKVFFYRKQLAVDLGRDPTVVELSHHCGLPPARVEELLRYGQETASLDNLIDEESMTSLGDLIRDQAVQDPPDNALRSLMISQLKELLGILTPRERKILELRYGLDGGRPLTLEETGKRLKITRERVRQIQEKALEKLRSHRVVQELIGVFHG